MINKFYPDLYVSSIYKINYKMLLGNGINNLIFDIDNTLVPHYEKYAPKKLVSHFKYLKSLGFKVCLLSNNNAKRVQIFNNDLNLDNIPYALKPFSFGLNKALKLMESDNTNTCIIGDQIFTDILVGNRKKLFTVLVKPVVNIDEFSVRIKRYPEKIVIKSYIKSKKA